MLGKTQTWHRLPDDAMKKEEIPKEILAGGDEASTDKSDKPKHAHKSKADKVKADKERSRRPPTLLLQRSRRRTPGPRNPSKPAIERSQRWNQAGPTM